MWEKRRREFECEEERRRRQEESARREEQILQSLGVTTNDMLKAADWSSESVKILL